MVVSIGEIAEGTGKRIAREILRTLKSFPSTDGRKDERKISQETEKVQQGELD